MNFFDTTANKAKRFEINQHLIVRYQQTKHYFCVIGPDACSQSFSFQRIH